MAPLVNAFPLWVLLASVAALVHPPLFTWFEGPLITVSLGLIMLGMGLTLQAADFRRVLASPWDVFVGVALQFLVMPALGVLVGSVFALPRDFAVGLILVACCPGGTASNVVAFLARANVALSVTLTAVSTVVAIAATPLLTTWLVGSRVPVSAQGLLFSTVQVVLLPIAAGLLLRRLAPRLTARLLPVAPLVAVVLITLIVASIIAGGRALILDAGLSLLAAVTCLHASGFALGYGLGRVLLRDEVGARTVSIEVGMQNSGLGVVLARANFASPAVAIPSAISSLVHSLVGSLLAALWRRRP